MEIVKISETEVKITDNQQLTKIYTLEEIDTKIKELTSKRANLLSRKASKNASFDSAIEPISMELVGFTNLKSLFNEE